MPKNDPNYSPKTKVKIQKRPAPYSWSIHHGFRSKERITKFDQLVQLRSKECWDSSKPSKFIRIDMVCIFWSLRFWLTVVIWEPRILFDFMTSSFKYQRTSIKFKNLERVLPKKNIDLFKWYESKSKCRCYLNELFVSEVLELSGSPDFDTIINTMHEFQPINIIPLKYMKTKPGRVPFSTIRLECLNPCMDFLLHISKASQVKIFNAVDMAHQFDEIFGRYWLEKFNLYPEGKSVFKSGIIVAFYDFCFILGEFVRRHSFLSKKDYILSEHQANSTILHVIKRPSSMNPCFRKLELNEFLPKRNELIRCMFFGLWLNRICYGNGLMNCEYPIMDFFGIDTMNTSNEGDINFMAFMNCAFRLCENTSRSLNVLQKFVAAALEQTLLVFTNDQVMALLQKDEYIYTPHSISHATLLALFNSSSGLVQGAETKLCMKEKWFDKHEKLKEFVTIYEEYSKRTKNAPENIDHKVFQFKQNVNINQLLHDAYINFFQANSFQGFQVFRDIFVEIDYKDDLMENLKKSILEKDALIEKLKQALIDKSIDYKSIEKDDEDFSDDEYEEEYEDFSPTGDEGDGGIVGDEREISNNNNNNNIVDDIFNSNAVKSAVTNDLLNEIDYEFMAPLCTPKINMTLH